VLYIPPLPSGSVAQREVAVWVMVEASESRQEAVCRSPGWG
jgi:hypothetical protein